MPLFLTLVEILPVSDAIQRGLEVNRQELPVATLMDDSWSGGNVAPSLYPPTSSR
jgi:hypothetical protein